MAKSERILIVDNDAATVQPVKIHLEMQGFEVQIMRGGMKALEHCFDSRYNLVILGWTDGCLPAIEICRQIRASDQYTPIIMLGDRKGNGDAVQSLEAGCDDYITAPVCIRELSARVKAILRRCRLARQVALEKIGGRRIEVNGLVIDSGLRRVTVRGATVNLTAKEYDLLYLMASNPGTVFSRRLILDLLWDHGADIYEHTVNSHINRLREKVEKDPGSPKYILTIWGIGYRFAD